MDAHKNFAYSTIATAPSPATSGTSIAVAAGDGAKFPAVPFNATVWPVSAQPTTANAEIVRVTNIATDTLTITRTQESTSARTVIVGDQIAATITAKTLTDVEAAIPSVPVSSVFARTGAVVAATGDYQGVVAAALTGATAATRFVGGTTSGAPASGTFVIGDFVVARNGHIFVCTVAGSPGTWVDVGSVSNLVTSVFGRTGGVVATSGDYTLNQIGNATGDYSINSHKLTNVTDPGSAQDAATKNYVDTAVGAKAGTADVQVFAAGAGQTWTRPSAAKAVKVICIGAGGGGGGGTSSSANTQTGGGGGGGASVVVADMQASDAGSSQTVGVGTGGTGEAPLSAGGDGGATTFGSLVAAYGGGGGAHGTAATVQGGAGASTGASSTGSTAANPTASFQQATGGQSGAARTGVGSPAEAGGAAGGATAANGGCALLGGAGGGGGGSRNSSGVGSNGSAGGTSQSYSNGGGGTLGTGGASVTNGGDGSAAVTPYCGAGGGGGGGGSTGVNGGNGGKGGIGSGGGGGGIGNTGGTGGNGGDGRCIVISYF